MGLGQAQSTDACTCPRDIQHPRVEGKGLEDCMAVATGQVGAENTGSRHGGTKELGRDTGCFWLCNLKELHYGNRHNTDSTGSTLLHFERKGIRTRGR